MSKNKQTNKVKEATVSKKVVAQKTEDSETITLNLQPYLLPIAIVVNAIIIAVAILLAGRGTATTTVATDTTVIPTVAAAEETDPNSTETTTSIGNSPYLGNKDAAKIAIVEFSDYECPFCKRHHLEEYPEIIANYIDTNKAIYVYKNYIAVPSHDPAATQEAYAALCARELSGNSNAKYFEMGDLIYTNTGTNGAGLSGGNSIYTFAETLGLNADQFKTCVESGKYADTMSTDEQAALSAGIQGTPGFVVGVLNADGSVDGKIIAGAYPFSEFQRIAEEMLAK